jgi:hypothetical protein
VALPPDDEHRPSVALPPDDEHLPSVALPPDDEHLPPGSTVDHEVPCTTRRRHADRSVGDLMINNWGDSRSDPGLARCGVGAPGAAFQARPGQGWQLPVRLLVNDRNPVA